MATTRLITTILMILFALVTETTNIKNETTSKAEYINEYAVIYSENTRVAQWKHYFEVIRKASAKRTQGRETYSLEGYNKLIEAGIPKERAEIYAELPEIESDWRSTAISPRGAIGLWQIMPKTGANYGYKLKDLRNPIKNMECAVKYISFLDSLFSGDVATVLFAYNGGEGTIKAAMERFKTTNTWLIEFEYRETYNFAPKVLGLWLYNKENNI